VTRRCAVDQEQSVVIRVREPAKRVCRGQVVLLHYLGPSALSAARASSLLHLPTKRRRPRL
jgi:hypothetical protein